MNAVAENGVAPFGARGILALRWPLDQGRGTMLGEPSSWYDETADNPPWISALAEVRHRAPREGHCYAHVQAIIVAIDQYAEAALGNRNYFLNRPHGIGRRDDRAP